MAVTRRTLRLARDIRVHLDSQVDAATRALVAAWARAWDEIAAEWQAAVDELIADGNTPTRFDIIRSQRAQHAVELAVAELDRLSQLTGVTVTHAAIDVLDGISQVQAEAIASQLPEAAGTQADLVIRFDRVHPDALNAIVQRSTQQITALTRPITQQARDAMLRSLVRGIAVGDNPKRTAAEMLRRVQGEFNGGLTRALVIARTETIDAYRAGAMVAQQANHDVLRGWMWSAQLDKRTCPSCWAQHGSEHPLDQPGPLDHQQGRCARVPLTKTWRQLGFAIDEPPSVVPDGRETFARLSKADQLEIMGPSRLEALNSGAISWSDLSKRRQTVGWRPSYAPIPIRDVRQSLRAVG